MLVKDAIYFHSSDEDLRGAHSIGSEAQLF
jgi:hypothetical protein